MTFLCYSKCSTCKKAQKWLEQRGVAYTERPIKEERPSADELRAWQKASGLPLKKFFNTSGQLYKALQLKDKLPAMSEEEQLALLATDGMLVKRPILIGDGFVLVGFKKRSGRKPYKKPTMLKKDLRAAWLSGPFFKTCVLCAVTKRSFLRLQSRGRRERPWSIQNFRRCTGAGIVPCCCMRAP